MAGVGDTMKRCCFVLLSWLLLGCSVDRIPEPMAFEDAALPLTSAQSAVPPNGLAQLAVGGMRTCAVWNDGSAHCWGHNRYGELGDGSDKRPAKAVRVNRVSHIQQMALGDGHTCALTKDGEVFCWGEERDGKLGGHPEKARGAVQVRGMGKVVEIVAGYAHTCARNEKDDVFCWGRFVDRGNSSPSPIRIAHSFKPTRLVAAGDANCMLIEQGQIACWGYGLQEGVLPDGVSGRTMSPLRMDGLEGIVDIGISAHHGCGVRRDGKVFCWGTNEYGQLGLGRTDAGDKTVFHAAEVPGIDDAVHVAVGLNGNVCVQLRSGSVRCWGFDRSVQAGGGSASKARPTPVAIAGIERAVAMGVGYDFSCAALEQGGISCWGSNLLDELGQEVQLMALSPQEVPGLDHVKSIFAGREASCAVLDDGLVRCWGQAGDPRLSGPILVDGLTDAMSVALAARGQCVVRADGSVVCFGGTDSVFGGDVHGRPAPPALLKSIVPVQSVVFGEDHGCALGAAGKTFCWGDNDYGKVGPGVRRFAAAKLPLVVGNLRAVISVVAGADESCALGKNGSVWCWGSPNYPGTLATETEETVIHRDPTLVPGTEDAIYLAHGRRHGCVIVRDGTVRCWGRNDYFQIGQKNPKMSLEAVPVEGLDDVAALALGGYFSCARKKTGRVWCWGDNAFGQLGDGTTNERAKPQEIAKLADVVAIAAGHTHACAILQSGHVTCWGSNAWGEIGSGPVKASLKPLAVRIDR